MSNLLKRAVDTQEVPANLDLRIRTAIRANAQESAKPAPAPWRWFVPSLAAAVFAALAVALFIPKNNGIGIGQSEDNYIATVTSKVSNLMRVGLGDHIHCAVFRKYPKTPDPVEKMERELGPEYFLLMDAVKANAPAGFKLQMAHQCRFQGRSFIHLVLKNDEKLMSVVVAAKQDPETFAADRLVPALTHSGITFYQEGAAEFQIAAFENRSHLVYLISSEPQDKNTRLLLSMAAGLNDALPKS
ncbi:MAG: hypothetical protein ACKV2U_26515 [Bryobacteraceae bacterium]